VVSKPQERKRKRKKLDLLGKGRIGGERQRQGRLRRGK